MGERINIVDQQGQVTSIDSSELQLATDQGYHPETPEEAYNRKLQKDKGDLRGEVISGLLGAARGLTFSFSDRYLTKSGLMDAKDIREYEIANPLASIGSEVGGVVIPSLATGGAGAIGTVAKAGTIATRAATAIGEKVGANIIERAIGKEIAKGFITKAAEKGIAGGTEGALYGLGMVNKDDALGDPDSAGEKVIYSLAGGALLGSGLSLGSSLLKGVGHKTAGIMTKLRGTPGEEKLIAEEGEKLLLDFDQLSAKNAARIAAEKKASATMAEEVQDRMGAVAKSFDDDQAEVAAELRKVKPGKAPLEATPAAGPKAKRNAQAAQDKAAAEQAAKDNAVNAEMGTGASRAQAEKNVTQVIDDAKKDGRMGFFADMLYRFGSERARAAAGILGGDAKKIIKNFGGGQRGVERLREMGDDILNYKLPDGRWLAGFGDNVQNVAEKFRTAIKTEGEAIGTIINDVDRIAQQNKFSIDTDPLLSRLQKIQEGGGGKKLNVQLSPAHRKMVEAFDAQMGPIKDLLKDKNSVSFKELIDIRRVLDDDVFERAPGILQKTPEERGVYEYLWQARDALEDVAIKAGRELLKKTDTANKDMITQYLAHKRLYQNLVISGKIANERVGSMEGNRFFSPTDYGAGGIGSLLSPGGWPALVHGLAIGIVHRTLRLRGSSIVGSAVRKVAGLSALEKRQAESNLHIAEQAKRFITEAPAKIPLGTGGQVFEAIFGDDRIDDQADVKRFVAQLQDMKANPGKTLDDAFADLDIVSETAPNVAASIALKKAQVVGYLASVAPVDKTPVVSLQPELETRTIPPSEIYAFKGHVKGALFPKLVLSEIGAGAIQSPQTRDAFRTIWPSTYADFGKYVQENAMNLQKKLPYDKRIVIGAFFGVPLDYTATPDFLRFSQMMYKTDITSEQYGAVGNYHPARLDPERTGSKNMTTEQFTENRYRRS